MKNFNARKAMRAAWTNARKAARKFGGRPSEFFVEALRQAWAWVKATAAQVVEIVVARETAKAVMANAEITMFEGSVRKVGVWFPKSVLKDGAVPAWFFSKKLTELKMENRGWVAVDFE